MSTPAAPSQDLADRVAAELARTAHRLNRALLKHAGADRSLGISIGDRSMAIDPELVALINSLRERCAETGEALVRGLAWQVNALNDLEGRSAPPSDTAAVDEFEGRLLLAIAAGERITAEIDGIREKEQGSLGPRWTKVVQELRHRTVGVIRELQSALPEQALANLDATRHALAASSGTVPLEMNREAAPETDGAPPNSRTKRGRRPHERMRAPSRVVSVLGALLVCAALLHVAARWDALGANQQRGSFTLSDFSDVRGIIELEDCPPSVLLTARRATWESLSESGRFDLLEQTKKIIVAEGYQGILISTEDGTVVAQWTSHSGLEMF